MLARRTVRFAGSNGSVEASSARKVKFDGARNFCY